jgi:methionine-rich copper-binding protein CopC
MNLRRALCATLGTGLVLGAVAPALAHVEVTTTSPKTGAVVTHLPNPVKINFGEPPLRVMSVKVTRATTNHAVRARLNPTNAKQILVGTRDDRAGLYRVAWTIKAPDGDTQTGTFSFRVRR